MSLDPPGSSWSNPIWHGKWRIYISASIIRDHLYAYVHDDYDGAPDSSDDRFGFCRTIGECIEEIEEKEA